MSSGEPAIHPLEIGVRFRQQVLVLHYMTTANGVDLHRRRSMPIRGLSKSSDCYAVAQQLKQRHEKYLGSVATVMIEKFVRLLQETMKGCDLTEALKAVEHHFSLDLSEDMNKLSDRDLQRRKELMDLNFNRNRVKVGDPNFVYDKQVDFSQGEKLESGWDDEEYEEDFWD